MAHLINKSALVAEIESHIREIKCITTPKNDKLGEGYLIGEESAYKAILSFLDTLEVKEVQEEPVSNDLEEAARKIATRHSHISGDTYYANDAWFFKKGAQWQKENLWKPADGEDLPEIDSEMIALVEENEHYKAVFAHRPPEYWDGKNIITNEITRYYPKRYDKGGWNQPNVKWWLDLDLPKMQE